jgi:hypothetical protein
MGQPVNPLLGNQQALLGADPELYRQQLIQQEQARIGALPAQNQLGAQLGSLLGRGLVNVAQDRGFFEVTNPVLQNLTKIQSVYNTAMQAADPNDPLSFYRELQTRFADAGLGQQSFMATQELRKAEDLAEKAKGEKLRTQVLENELYTKNPTLLDEQIAKARDAGNDTLANRLAEQRGQIQIDIDKKRRKDELSMELLSVQTAAERAKIRKYNAEYEEGKLDKTAIPDQNGGGVIVYYDKKTRKEVDRIVVTSAIVDSVLNKGKPGTAPSGDKPSPASFDKRNQPAPAVPASSAAPVPAAPAAAPAAASPYDQASGTYKIALDPEYQQIQAEARANLQRLETEPAYQAEIQQRINALQAKIQANFGTRVVIQ